MDHIVTLFLNAVGLIILLGLGAFGVVSHFEGERRAARMSFWIGLVGGAAFLSFAAAPQPVPLIAFWVLILLGVGFIILFTLPIGRVNVGNDTPNARFDEREIMFARNGLQPGSPEYREYYALHPEHEAEDNLTRAKPGLLSPESKFANPYQFAATEGSFFLTMSMRDSIDGPVADTVHTLPPEEMTAYIKNLAIFYGAADVGVTALRPYHVYSHVGRGTGTYGEPIPVEHKYAIAFTVEMAFDLVGTGPYPPTSMETGKQYVESARVAVQLAGAIRALGYPARAHIDGNYRVIAPLVARDAGLGELGRMTILMTPRLGPRVRLGVVTTDLDLIQYVRQPNQAVIDFCTICEKCAHSCPSRSIPMGPRVEIDGALRWKLNPDTCFRYWNVAGTDCCRCMAVCPFAHPDTFSHNIIRWGIARSGFFRRAALWMDDLYYGVKPKRRDGPGWLDVP
jgi:ferredoxin